MDFDAKYELFIREWLKDNAYKYGDYDALELAAAEVYEVWVTEADLETGISPRDYFKGLSDGALAGYLNEISETGKKIPQIALDEFTGREFPLSLIIPVLRDMKNDELTVLYINAARKRETPQIIDIYCDYLAGNDADPDIMEVLYESLCENVTVCLDKLLALALVSDNNRREYICDILSNAHGDERVFRLLVTGLLTYDNVMLFSRLLARYGDDRALPYLYETGEVCDYAEFMEIQNSVFELGGETLAERSFSEDITFRRIKAETITKDKTAK